MINDLYDNPPAERTAEALTLELRKFQIAEYIDDAALKGLKLDWYTDYLPQRMARVVRAAFNVPGVPFPKRVLGEYPATWWDHTKKVIGFKKYRTVRIESEHFLAFPTVVPPRFADSVRIHLQYNTVGVYQGAGNDFED